MPSCSDPWGDTSLALRRTRLEGRRFAFAAFEDALAFSFAGRPSDTALTPLALDSFRRDRILPTRRPLMSRLPRCLPRLG